MIKKQKILIGLLAASSVALASYATIDFEKVNGVLKEQGVLAVQTFNEKIGKNVFSTFKLAFDPSAGEPSVTGDFKTTFSSQVSKELDSALAGYTVGAELAGTSGEVVGDLVPVKAAAKFSIKGDSVELIRALAVNALTERHSDSLRPNEKALLKRLARSKTLAEVFGHVRAFIDEKLADPYVSEGDRKALQNINLTLTDKGVIEVSTDVDFFKAKFVIRGKVSPQKAQASVTVKGEMPAEYHAKVLQSLIQNLSGVESSDADTLKEVQDMALGFLGASYEVITGKDSSR